MRFWDTSAIVPLLVKESSTDFVRASWRRDPDITVWWATEVECVSALARLERDGTLDVASVGEALARLAALSLAWTEIEPGTRVREHANRLLRTHALRASDALQLAAAIVAAEERPASLRLVSLDERVAGAASREGFGVEVPTRT
ncbi:MAG: PIN domain-containing protein [Anaerolinea sp.]|nr:PIN domain-containing protein [Anaerolinea sp.]